METDLTTELSEGEFKLSLTQNSKVIDFEGSEYYHDLSDKLITCLDKLIKKNKIDIRSIKTHRIQGNLGLETTSHKIAETFVEALKL